MSYQLDGKGNVYDTDAGRRVWSGDPQDVIAILEERDRVVAEVARLRELTLNIADVGFRAVYERDKLRQDSAT